VLLHESDIVRHLGFGSGTGAMSSPGGVRGLPHVGVVPVQVHMTGIEPGIKIHSVGIDHRGNVDVRVVDQVRDDRIGTVVLEEMLNHENGDLRTALLIPMMAAIEIYLRKVQVTVRFEVGQVDVPELASKDGCSYGPELHEMGVVLHPLVQIVGQVSVLVENVFVNRIRG